MMRQEPKRAKWIRLWNRLASSGWTPLALGILVIGLVLWMQMPHGKSVRPKPAPPPLSSGPVSNAAGDSARSAARRILKQYRLPVRVRPSAANRRERWEVRIPPGVPLPSVHLSLQEEMLRIGDDLMQAESDPATGKLTLDIGKKNSPWLILQLIPSQEEEIVKGRIALVIDDFGDRLDGLVTEFFNLDGKITVSVIPGRRLSTRVAKEANARGCEIILHLSMEPLHAAFREDGYTIMTKMPRADIQAAFQKSLNEIPFAVGVNNHMGSRATSDRQTMVDVLEEIKQKGLYFMDSYTVASSVAYAVAREMGVPCAKRDVFVDVDGAEPAIRLKLQELARKAKKEGSAVGIGHCHRNMLNALQGEIPKLQKDGFKLVPLSEVVR
jgi:uncharacterized protein